MSAEVTLSDVKAYSAGVKAFLAATPGPVFPEQIVRAGLEAVIASQQIAADEQPTVAGETVVDAFLPEHPHNEQFAWIVTTHHAHCPQCNEQIDAAIVHAKVTGSVGATYNVTAAGGSIVHGAKVARQTLAQRRVELGLAPA